MTVTDQLVLTTTRLDVSYPNARRGTGTGTYVHFRADRSSNSGFPVIVTNKHVVDGATEITFVLTTTERDGKPADPVSRLTGPYDPQLWHPHPDPDVDLTAFPIGPLLNGAEAQKIKFQFNPLSTDLIPSDDELRELGSVENVLMIGYPIGLWDETNNRPISRRGITATHPGLDYNGKAEFMIDAACYPGSSGSPVFLYDQGAFPSGGGMTVGTRVKLLGILYAAPQWDAQGRIHAVPVPTAAAMVPVPVTRMPLNLGIVIKARRLLELESVVVAALSRPQARPAAVTSATDQPSPPDGASPTDSLSAPGRATS